MSTELQTAIEALTKALAKERESYEAVSRQVKDLQRQVEELRDRLGKAMITRDEAADFLRISKRHVINLEKAGHIPKAVVLGKKALLEKEAVVRYLTNQQQKRQQYATSQ